ncbi:protein JTB isoform X1 [Gallus gallus]|uniref:protein JTB isoform X1 n=1 Tax=Gallus gallus TaxID=9031 RepID=UPI001AE6E3A7|nr:protein JTB isoform X1 [Gallus gallus]
MWSRRGAGPRCCALCALLGALCALLGAGLRPVTAVAAMAASEERRSASPATPCWRREEFVVARECGRCSGFEVKSIPECGPTGFVEKISCAASKRDEYKRYPWHNRGAATEPRRVMGHGAATRGTPGPTVTPRTRRHPVDALSHPEASPHRHGAVPWGAVPLSPHGRAALPAVLLHVGASRSPRAVQ